MAITSSAILATLAIIFSTYWLIWYRFVPNSPINHRSSAEQSHAPTKSKNEDVKRDYNADVVAVHGLTLSPATAWRSRAQSVDKQVRDWLDDLLANESINVRPMKFTYDAHWKRGATNKSLRDHGVSLLLFIQNRRKSPEERKRPLIFVGHSYGGLIVKQMFVDALLSSGEIYNQNICQSTKGFIFLGTPHKGTQFYPLGRFAALVGYWFGSSTRLLDLVQIGSEQNQALHHSFMTCLDRTCKVKNVVCVFEAIPESVCGLPLGEVVPKDSAQIDGANNIGFDNRHRDIQRYNAFSDENYRILLGYITDWTDILPSSNLTIEDGALLKTLAFSEMRDRRSNVEKSQPGTCEWIFELPKYLSWTQAPAGLLWIKGKPGAGKSTLMKHLYKQYENDNSARRNILLDFFFSARGSEFQKSPIGMLRSLLHQLYFQERASRQPIQQLYRDKLALGPSWSWQRLELEDLFLNALKRCTKSRNISIFVDALDECGEDNAKKVAIYFHTLNERLAQCQVNAKICISCRHYPITTVVIKFEIWVERHNRHDISTFLNSKLDRSSLKHGEQFSTEEWHGFVAELAKNAQGVFQWASIVADLAVVYVARGWSLAKIQHDVQALRGELENVYSVILRSIIPVEHREEALQLFQWVYFAQGPLKLTELRYAFACDDNNLDESLFSHHSDITPFAGSDEQMRTLVTTFSGGLVEVQLRGNFDPDQDLVVQVIHQSVRDFMSTKGFLLLFESVGRPQTSDVVSYCSHHRLFRACLLYLINIDVVSSGLQLETIQEDNDDGDYLGTWCHPHRRQRFYETFPFVHYTTRAIFAHATQAQQMVLSEESFADQMKYLKLVLPKWRVAKCVIDGQFESGRKQEKEEIFSLDLLHIASKYNLKDILNRLIDEGVDLNKVTKKLNTALHFAAKEGNEEVGDLLIEAGAKIDEKNQNFETPLSNAAGSGSSSFFRLLLNKGALLNDSSPEFVSPLYTACKNGQMILVQQLLGLGAGVNAYGRNGTPLYAAVYYEHERIVEYLLDRKADVNADCGRFGTVLQVAASGGSLEIVQLLLNHGAEVNHQGGRFGAALQAAAYEADLEIVQILLDRGAQVNQLGGEFGTALQAAAYRGSLEVVQLLLSRRAEVNRQAGAYGTALRAAVWRGNSQTIQLLIKNGADVTAQYGKYGTVLSTAAISAGMQAEEMACEIAQFLINKGALVNVPAGRYGSALCFAARWGRKKMVQLLLENGAKVNLRGPKRGTAVQIAYRCAISGKCKKCVEIINVLKEYGAIDEMRTVRKGVKLHKGFRNSITWSEDLLDSDSESDLKVKKKQTLSRH